MARETVTPGVVPGPGEAPPSPPAASPRRPSAAARLAGFDGLRAIAALAIVGYHVALTSPITGTTFGFTLALQLRFGVWIFFVLSGFLLYRPHARAHAQGRPGPPVRPYAWSRVLRLVPAYVVALVVLTYVVHKTHAESPGDFFSRLGLVQIYVPDGIQGPDRLSQVWSLATEVSFYVFLPFYAAGIGALARRVGAWKAELLGLAALLAVGIPWQYFVLSDEARYLRQSTWLPGWLPIFGIGIALAVLVAHDAVPRAVRRVASHGTLCWLGALAILLVKAEWLETSEGFAGGYAGRAQLLFGAAALLVVLPVFAPKPTGHVVGRFLDSRPLVALGTISYGIFLWHYAMVDIAQRDWVGLTHGFTGDTAVVLVSGLSVTIVIATLSWFLVERPALRLRERMRRT